MSKIAWSLIVKGTEDEAVLLDQCLTSFEKHVDKIFIDVNAPKGKKPSQKVIDVCEKHTVDYRTTVWEDNFVKARNELFARIPKDYEFIGWCDTDDTIENPEKIRDVIAILPNYIDGLFIKYDYDHDPYGNVTVSHYVARVVRNNGSFAWKSSFDDSAVTVHETLVERRRVGQVMNNEFKVVHHSDEDRRDRSLVRNIKLLEGMLNSSKTPDPRILYYLATHYLDAFRYAEAKELLETYLTLSGWPDERSQAHVHLGNLAKRQGDLALARNHYLAAAGEAPNDPSPYVELGELEYDARLFDKSVTWLETAVSKKLKDTTLIIRPMDTTFRAYMLLAQSHVNIGGKNLDTAHAWVNKALTLRPTDPEAQSARDVVEELIRIRELTVSATKLVGALEKTGEESKVPQLLETLPADIQDSPAILRIRRHYIPPIVWPEKSVAIFAGAGPLGIWGPWSLKEGIGGSEEAIVRLSRQLVKQGYKVTVYATPGHKTGTFDGVEYKNYWEINLKDTFDVLISWRAPHHFDAEIKARKKYMWIHDVMDDEEFTPERVANCDKVILLSQYHRSLYPFIPDDKVFLSRNGIDVEDFVKNDGKFKRDPHKVIYMSSHVRGLELLYSVWPDVKKAIPKASLAVYYGWDSYDAVNRGNPERMAWKERMLKYEQELPDVVDYGKVSQEVIVEEISKSGVWAYPCPFPEISCITAMKAQAGGAVPISSDFAALDETVQRGVKVHMEQMDERTPLGLWDKAGLEQFRDALIDMLKDTKKQESIRGEMIEFARNKLSWSSVAKEWIIEFES